MSKIIISNVNSLNQENNQNFLKFKEWMLKISELISEIDIQNKIKSTLLHYQPIRVTQYEIDRCVYTIKNIIKIEKYFTKNPNINIAVFLPSNLPLYSLMLFVIIPSYFAKNVVVRPSLELVKQIALESLFDTLKLKDTFSNIELFLGDREKFVKEYVTKADLVIFTGRNETKDRIKESMKPESFMINNGSGHNPIVVAKDANIDQAIRGVLYAKFFNAGQDCAGPDAVFVQKQIISKFLPKFVEKVCTLKVGDHSDSDTIIGKIYREKELSRLQDIINSNKIKTSNYFYSNTVIEKLLILEKTINIEKTPPIIIKGKVDTNNKIVYPTIIILDIETQNLNYKEIFGPILFLYVYECESQLKSYFESDKYIGNKMYVSLFGKSEYISIKDDSKLIKEKGTAKGGVGVVLENKIIHDITVDNGTIAYGGYSKGASSVIYKDQNNHYSSVALPILIPEIIDKLFIQKIPIIDIPFSNRNKIRLSDNSQTLKEMKKKLSKEFIDLVKESFKYNVIFAFIFGSIADGCATDKSDIDSFICVKKKDKDQVSDFKKGINRLHKKFELKIDHDYPFELVEYTTLLEESYHLYYQLYGENYISCMDDAKFNCSFLIDFKCSNRREYDVTFWVPVIAESKKIALVNKDKVLLSNLITETQEVTAAIKKEIIQNIESVKEANLPEVLKEKYPNLSNKEISSKLENLSCCEILRHVEWVAK